MRLDVVTDLDPAPPVDIASGVYSTYLYDMLLNGVHIGILETVSYYGEGVVQNGLVEYIF